MTHAKRCSPKPPGHQCVGAGPSLVHAAIVGAELPADLRYTRDGWWARVDADVVTVGLTPAPVEKLDQILDVQPERAGTEVTAGEPLATITGAGAVEDIASPFDATVVAVNEALIDPGLVNTDPYGRGYLVRMRLSRTGQLDGLLDAEAYRKTLGG